MYKYQQFPDKISSVANSIYRKDLDYLIKKAYLRLEKNKNLRLGQAFYNELYKLYPKIAQVIRATTLDPFNNSAMLINLLIFLKK